MSEISEYWYEKKEIPEKEKIRIKELVKGDIVGEFDICGTTHNLLRVSGNVFRDVFIENRKFLYKGDYTAPSEENDYLNSINYLSEDGLAGFSITSKGWLVSLFSNYKNGGFARAIKKFIVNHAYKLVCIVANTEEGNKLVELYKNIYGFREYVTTINDTDIMRKYYGDDFINSFTMKRGTPFHVFMIGETAKGVGNDIKKFQNYYEAEEYVNNSVTFNYFGEN